MWFRKSLCVLQVIVILNVCGATWPCSLYAKAETQGLVDFVSPSTTTDETDRRTSLALPGRPGQVKDHDAPSVEQYLLEGNLHAGEVALRNELRRHTKVDQVRFGLGTLQFLRAVEQLSQDLCRYGFPDTDIRRINASAIIRSALPKKATPEALSYQGAREMAKTFLRNLAAAEATLAPIVDADVKLPLHFGMIRLDLNGDGVIHENESLWKLYAGLNNHRNISEETARGFYITFDRGDVHWLRGYCHLLMAVCEVYLAHDTRETFERTAHLLFANVDSPYKFLSKREDVTGAHGDFDLPIIMDIVAIVHTIRWSVVEPERMASALRHLEAVVAQSKVSWKWIMSETDDDREWLPNPRQTGVIPDVHVTDEMVDAWQTFMDQAGKLLAGKVLIPFWRGDDRRGINLRKVFMKPRTLDLVLWVQGSAAAPYLERGQKIAPGTWGRLQQVFGARFPGFAVWFN